MGVRTSLTIIAALCVVAVGTAGQLFLKPLALDALRQTASALVPAQTEDAAAVPVAPTVPVAPAPPRFPFHVEVPDVQYHVAAVGDEASLQAIERLGLVRALVGASEGQDRSGDLELADLRVWYEREIELECDRARDEAIREASEHLRQAHEALRQHEVRNRTFGRVEIGRGTGGQAAL